MDGHQFRGARIHRDMMLVSSVCRRALGCEWGEVARVRTRNVEDLEEVSDQVIRENPASRGTETSAEVLVGPPWRIESNAGQQQWCE
jgi:hypothetical protein